MFFLFLLFLFFGSTLSTNSVFIHQSPQSYEFPILTCTISGVDADKFSPHLYCPLTKSRMCYTNCTKECKFANGKCNSLTELEAIYACKYTFFSSDHIQIQFHINAEKITSNLGEWYCSYAGVNSKAISLNIPQKSITATIKNDIQNKKPNLIRHGKEKETPVTPESVRVYKVPHVIEVMTDPTITSEAQQIIQNIQSNDDISFKAFITKFQVVIGILVLFTISVLLNIVFCIRDSMIKYYIDNIKNNVPSHKALLFCVCQNDPIASSKFDPMLSRDSEYFKDDYHFSKSNVYESESQRPLMAQRGYPSEIRPPNIGRSRSFQQNSPIGFHGSFDPNYMSMPRGFSPYISYNNFARLNPQYPLAGSMSLTGSDTPMEEVIREGQYQIDGQGNSVLLKMVPNNAAGIHQNMDLINDCDQNHTSQSTLNLSKDQK